MNQHAEPTREDPPGRVLAELPRFAGESLRVSLETFRGHPAEALLRGLDLVEADRPPDRRPAPSAPPPHPQRLHRSDRPPVDLPPIHRGGPPDHDAF